MIPEEGREYTKSTAWSSESETRSRPVLPEHSEGGPHGSRDSRRESQRNKKPENNKDETEGSETRLVGAPGGPIVDERTGASREREGGRERGGRCRGRGSGGEGRGRDCRAASPVLTPPSSYFWSLPFPSLFSAFCCIHLSIHFYVYLLYRSIHRSIYLSIY